MLQSLLCLLTVAKGGAQLLHTERTAGRRRDGAQVRWDVTGLQVYNCECHYTCNCVLNETNGQLWKYMLNKQSQCSRPFPEQWGMSCILSAQPWPPPFQNISNLIYFSASLNIRHTCWWGWCLMEDVFFYFFPLIGTQSLSQTDDS